jgi:hypothetical protein
MTNMMGLLGEYGKSHKMVSRWAYVMYNNADSRDVSCTCNKNSNNLSSVRQDDISNKKVFNEMSVSEARIQNCHD